MFAVAGGEGGDKEGASTTFFGQYSFAQVQAMSAIIGLAMLLYVMGRSEETQEVGEKSSPYVLSPPLLLLNRATGNDVV